MFLALHKGFFMISFCYLKCLLAAWPMLHVLRLILTCDDSILSFSSYEMSLAVSLARQSVYN